MAHTIEKYPEEGFVQLVHEHGDNGYSIYTLTDGKRLPPEAGVDAINSKIESLQARLDEAQKERMSRWTGRELNGVALYGLVCENISLQAQLDEFRPEVRVFALAMENTLKENDHKGGWSEMPIDELLSRVEDECIELDDAINSSMSERYHPRIQGEAVDIANFAMMIFDNAGKAEVV